MPTLPQRISRFAFCVCLATAAALPAFADEIRLKDGKKLYGVIVAYEDNMFKVKTDFGYVLVEKDKIASIIPTAPAASKTEKDASAKPPAAKPEDAAAKPAADSAKISAAVQPAADKSAVARPSPAKTPADTKTSAKPSDTPPATVATNSASVQPPAQPKEPELPPNREEIQGNTYTNFTHHFRMYKAPSWELIEDARRALPNAIVAMGTSNESTLMIVGEEKSGASLEISAATVEKRLREVYENYRRISQDKITVAGQPAVKLKYRGLADEHDWSGTLVVIPRGPSTLTVLGMTYADNDLIQIQENVIARAISSLDFSVQ